jgi:hypothetical protein
MPSAFQGLFAGSSGSGSDPDAWRHIAYSDLESWRGAHGWDRNSLIAAAEIDLDPDSLRLSLSPLMPLPRAQTFPFMHTDLLGKDSGGTRIAGPLVDIRAQHGLAMDPRLPS